MNTFKTKYDNDLLVVNFTTKENLMTIESIFKDNQDRYDSCHYGELSLDSGFALEQVILYPGAISIEGEINIENSQPEKYNVENPHHIRSYQGYNQATVREIVLCTINERACYDKLKSIMQLYGSDSNQLSLKIEEYFKFAYSTYVRVHLSPGDTLDSVATKNDIKQIKKEILDNYIEEFPQLASLS